MSRPTILRRHQGLVAFCATHRCWWTGGGRPMPDPGTPGGRETFERTAKLLHGCEQVWPTLVDDADIGVCPRCAAPRGGSYSP